MKKRTIFTLSVLAAFALVIVISGIGKPKAKDLEKNEVNEPVIEVAETLENTNVDDSNKNSTSETQLTGNNEENVKPVIDDNQVDTQEPTIAPKPSETVKPGTTPKPSETEKTSATSKPSETVKPNTTSKPDKVEDEKTEKPKIDPTVDSDQDEEQEQELEHVHNYTAKVVNATCTASGYTEHRCACGHAYNDSITEIVAHKYKDGVCDGCGEKQPQTSEPNETTHPDEPESTPDVSIQQPHDHSDCDHVEIIQGAYTYVYCSLVQSPYLSADGFIIYYPYEFYF